MALTDVASPEVLAHAEPTNAEPTRPNFLIFFTDQQRWDSVGVYGNPMGLTPTLDALARRGTLFTNAMTTQPVCAPARACLWTGMYQNRHGVWVNGRGLAPEIPTLARHLKQAGYVTGYIGKWHLAPHPKPEQYGPVPREWRGGFVDLWEASNVLEHTSHPYEGSLYDDQGKEIRFEGVYRTDFLTQRAVRFLKEVDKEPFLLVISYLEPHQQNDMKRFVAPEGYAARYANPFVPEDLRPFPGDWFRELPDYYGCIARLDDNLATLLQALDETGRLNDTVVVFVSDHGCHFCTRNTEYKRSPHESSIHIPLVIAGPHFNRSVVVPEVVSLVDITPTLLEVAGLPEAAAPMQGRSLLPLVERRVAGWRNEAFVQISEYMLGRALRTERFTYCAIARDRSATDPSSERYVEWFLYDLHADPHQLVNLVARAPYREVSRELRERLISRIREVEGMDVQIEPARFTV